jgi:dynein heavy chain 2
MVFGDLMKMNNMYQFSLQSFIKLFNRALDTKPQASNTKEKLQKLSNSLIKLCYSETGRSLFKSDRLTYSLFFIKGVFADMFGQGEWDFFNGNTTATAQSSISLPKWASKDRAEIFAMFCNSFGNLIHAMQIDNDNMWRDFAESDTPEVAFPQKVMQNVSPF